MNPPTHSLRPRHALLALVCLGSSLAAGCSVDGRLDQHNAADQGRAAVDAGASDAAGTPRDATLAGDAARADVPGADGQRTDTASPQAPDASAPDSVQAPSEDDAVVVSHTLPATMDCGAARTASVTMRNSGTATWSHDLYKLGTVDDSDPFHSADTRVWLPAGTTIAPGQTHTFTFTLTAPTVAGAYLTDWRMVHELVRWFGATASMTVQVECGPPVDRSTMTGKMLMGYQGWFACQGDGSPPNSWIHWFRSGSDPSADQATFDLWPDLSEFDADELYDTNMTMRSGGPARLYSPWNAKSVARHFRWMRDNGIDGVLLQRFASEVGDASRRELRDQVTRNVRAGAEANGRLWAMEYDISGMHEADFVAVLKSDWSHLVNDLHVLESPNYLHHRGRPVLVIWGPGFTDRVGTPAQAADLIAWFKSNAPAGQQVTLVGGVPTYWRTLAQDSKSDSAWAAVYRSYDVINPWAVGRFNNDSGANSFKNNLIVPDLAECHRLGIDYMPVVWPGFSWHNLLPANPVNQIPRRGGAFYWRQVYNAVGAGAPMLFNAMFDEVDEGTAMMKGAPTQQAVPVEGSWLAFDADGQSLPADWYLRLAGEASRMLRGERALTATIPISP